MLELRRIRAFDIAQRRVSLDDAARYEIVQLRHVSIGFHPTELYDMWLTPRRYFSCPSRSRYRRQNGSVPKFLLIEFNSERAEETRRGTLGASAFLA